MLGDFEAVLKLVNRENLSGAVPPGGEDDAQTTRATPRDANGIVHLEARFMLSAFGSPQEHAGFGTPQVV